MKKKRQKHVLHALNLLLDDVTSDVDRDESSMVVGLFTRHGYGYSHHIQVKVTRKEEDFLLR